MKKITRIILISGSILFILLFFLLFRYLWLSRYYFTEKEHINNAQEKDDSGLTDFTIEIYNGKIEPSSFTVKAGQEVKLKIVSMEGIHSLVFENEGLSWIGGDFKESGETLEITFTAPREPGRYLFYCTKNEHKEKGEKGEMIVE